jgi:predicted metal-binding membrane protein
MTAAMMLPGAAPAIADRARSGGSVRAAPFVAGYLAVWTLSVRWMAAIAALAPAQKLTPPRASVDAALAAALIAFGIAVLAAPAAIPGLTPTM